MKNASSKAFKEYAMGTDSLFEKAFALAKGENSSLLMTKRQYSRWKQGRGQSYAKRAAAQEASKN